jgi:uncharacterized protein YjiS (DUF1127 family)
MREQSEGNEGAGDQRLGQRHRFRRAERLPEKKKMTTISQTAGQSLSPPSSGGFFRAIVNSAYAVLDFLERRAAIKTLNELDDRALRDIGITRSQIEDAVGGSFKNEMMRYL